MYCDHNFQSKKQLKEAVAQGMLFGLHQVGPFGGGDYRNGTFTVEGPHYPQPHRWYAQVTMRDGKPVKVK
jgi:hypothetical protein